MITLQVKEFSEWRDRARTLIKTHIPPEDVLWAGSDESLLFGSDALPQAEPTKFTVPKPFIKLAAKASLHRNERKWSLLYKVLWRLVYESRDLLSLSTDADVAKLKELEGEVRRDCHKMKAFVRFRKSGDNAYIAWHEPSHLIVESVAPFFARRFSSMTWAILTPDTCAYWDQQTLSFGPGAQRSQAPTSDELEELWKTYYSNIFNPSRVKIQAMVGEMPKKYWHTMPETALIQELLLKAPEREQKMIESAQSQRRLPIDIVAEASNLGELKSLARDCQGCELCHSATQTVFGEGLANAKLMFIGEQPGDREDRVGQPFVGPAGRLFRTCLERINLHPDSIYLTNTVKHFRWEESPTSGRRRIHKRASWRQIEVCKPWVEAEIAMVAPKVIVLLGATALQTLVGKEFRIGADRGKPLPSNLAPHVVATVHPSSLLRMDDSRLQQIEIGRFCRDLQMAVELSSA